MLCHQSTATQTLDGAPSNWPPSVLMSAIINHRGQNVQTQPEQIHIERQQKILENAVEDDLLKTKEKFNILANETKEALKNLRSYIV